MSIKMTSDDFISENDIGLLQLSDSFFPTGLYANSNGLELLFYNKNKKLTYENVFHFIKAYVLQQIGPTDCSIIGNIYNSTKSCNYSQILELDNLYYCMRLIEETRYASTRSGLQLLRCISSFIGNNEFINYYLKNIKSGHAKGVYPISFALSCNAMNIKKEKSALMFAYGFTVCIVGAALRLGVLQHYDGQRLIHEMKPILVSSVLENINRSSSDIWQFIPQLDIIQIHHEMMDSKMFIT